MKQVHNIKYCGLVLYKKTRLTISNVRVLILMEQVSRIELPSQPWQGRILTAVLHLRK